MHMIVDDNSIHNGCDTYSRGVRRKKRHILSIRIDALTLVISVQLEITVKSVEQSVSCRQLKGEAER